MSGRLALCATLLALGAGCVAERAYQGPERSAAELARIEGSPRINAGLPLAAVIRKIDDQVVGIGHARVLVLPGSHRLLIDCVMAATRTTTRFELTVETYAGRRYVLVADSAPGNLRCGSVRADER